MSGERSRARRWALSMAVAAGFAAAAFAAVAPAALAASGTYTVNVTPGTAAPDTSTTFNVALTNTSSAGVTMEEAAVVVPSGFNLTSASIPTGSGSVDILSSTILLGNLSVASGSTLNVTVTAGTPAKCGGTSKWLTQASSTDFWTGLLTYQSSGSSVNTTFAGCTLVFATQPAEATVNTPITGTADDPTGPPVTVEIVNPSGHLVSTPAQINLAIGTNPGGATLLGGLSVPATGGIAKFKHLSLNKPGSGYTLTASKNGLPVVASNAFDEDQTQTTTCTSTPCKSKVTSPESSLSISVNKSAGTVTESLDVGTPLSCAARIYGDYVGFDSNWYGLSITGSSDKQLTYTLDGSFDDVEVCFGATADFTTNTGGEAAAGTLPDGTSGFIGLLPDCSNQSSVGPCIESIGGDDTTITTIDIPQAFAGDPWTHM